MTADCRAATPSNAAELAVPDRREIHRRVANTRGDIHLAVRGRIIAERQRLDLARWQLGRTLTEQASAVRRCLNEFWRRPAGFEARLAADRQAVVQVAAGATRLTFNRLQAIKGELTNLTAILGTLSPTAVLARGYSLTFAVSTGSLVRHLADVPSNGKIATKLADGQFASRVVAPRPHGPTRQSQNRLF